MGIVDRFAELIAGTADAVGRAARTVSAPGSTQKVRVAPSGNPEVTAPSALLPGIPHYPTVRVQNGKVDEALKTVEAYFGRVSFDAGPSPTRYSSYPANDLTPEKIIGAQQEAVAGYPLRWSEMIEQVLSRDSHLAGIGQQRVDDVAKGTWRLVRSMNDDVAACLRNVCEEALRGTDDFEDGLAWLLWSNAYCYNATEVTWKRQRTTFAGPNGEIIGPVELVVPRRLDNVHAKHFRFDLRTDEPYLWLGSSQVSLPFGKFIFLKGEGQHPITERRGYLWQCIWLSMFKSIGWSGWATFVERFGLPTPLLLYEGGLETYNEHRQTLQDILTNLGKGYGAIAPQEGLKIDQLQFQNGGRSADPHSAISDACEAAQSVRVLGATLTAKIGNVGSFAASSAHMEVKYAKEEADARRLWASVRSQLMHPFVFFNADVLAPIIADALRQPVTADMLLRRVPRGLHRVPREVDPMVRMQMTDLAVNKLGLKVSSEAMYDEMNFAQPLNDEDILPGEALQVSSGGALVGGVKAAHEGAEAPPVPSAQPAPKSDDEDVQRQQVSMSAKLDQLKSVAQAISDLSFAGVKVDADAVLAAVGLKQKETP